MRPRPAQIPTARPTEGPTTILPVALEELFWHKGFGCWAIEANDRMYVYDSFSDQWSFWVVVGDRKFNVNLGLP